MSRYLSVPQPSPISVDIRSAFARDAATVWVVTAADGDTPTGFTAISVRSVSLDPPLISFNLGKNTSSRGTIEGSGRVAAHLLTHEQESTARVFAGPRDHRFRGRHWRWHDDGLPSLNGCLLRLSGTVLSLTDAGDSLLALVHLNRVEHGVGEPLLHYDRGYRSLTTTPEPLLAAQNG